MTEENVKKESKPSKPKRTAEEKYEARKTLLQLLLIILIGVASLYLGFNLGVGIIFFVLWAIGSAFGVV